MALDFEPSSSSFFGKMALWAHVFDLYVKKNNAVQYIQVVFLVLKHHLIELDRDFEDICQFHWVPFRTVVIEFYL